METAGVPGDAQAAARSGLPYGRGQWAVNEDRNAPGTVPQQEAQLSGVAAPPRARPPDTRRKAHSPLVVIGLALAEKPQVKGVLLRDR
jgi:hypothetical protein